MRVAYLITAYNNPDLLNALIDPLLEAAGEVFIHFDSKCALSPADVARRDEVHFVDNRVCVHWGDNGFAESIIRLLELALQTGEYDYFNSLSGTDLPIRPVAEFHERLAAMYPRNILPGKPVDLARREMRKRLQSYYLIHERTPLALLAQRLLFSIGLHVMPRRLPRDLEFYFGSAWLTVNADTARWLVQNWRDPANQQLFGRMFCTDEIFFPTFIANAPDQPPPCNDRIRYIVWQGQGSPKTLDDEDWEPMMASGAFFARKFDPSRSAPIIQRLSAFAPSLSKTLHPT